MTQSPFIRFVAAGAAATKAFAARLAALLQAGDLLILTGGLGAGKTTFTQGMGAALGAEGSVSSPTFIIAREHRIPATGGVGQSALGPQALVHVDAYRLGGAIELDALDLDSALEDSVTVIEWGGGVAEQLSADRLEIEIKRPRGNYPVEVAARTVGEPGLAAGAEVGEGAEFDLAADPEAGLRVITCRGIGPRWANVDLAVLAG